MGGFRNHFSSILLKKTKGLVGNLGSNGLLVGLYGL